MKGLRVILVALLIIIGTSSMGFAGGAQEKGRPVTLTAMYIYNVGEGGSEVTQERINQWQAEHPEVVLESDAISHEELEQKSATLAAANELPDFININGKDISAWGPNAGMLLNLEPYLDKEWWDQQVPGAHAEWYRGKSKTYAVSTQTMVTHLFYYNSEMLKDAGYTKPHPVWGGNFPDTWDSLKSTLVKLKNVVDTPWVMGDNGKWLFVDPIFGTLALKMCGADWQQAALRQEAKFTDPKFIKALELMNEIIDLGVFNEDAPAISNDEQRAIYFNAKAAMFVEGSWALTSVYDSAPREVAEATHLAVWPSIPGEVGNNRNAVMLGGWGWGLSSRLEKDKAKLEAGVSLLKALSDETYGRMRLERGLLPAQIITEYDDSGINPLSQEFFEMLPKIEGVPHLMIPFGADPEDAMATGLQEMFIGKLSPREVAEKVQNVWKDYPAEIWD